MGMGHCGQISRKLVGAFVSLYPFFLACYVRATEENMTQRNRAVAEKFAKTSRNIRFTLLFFCGLFRLRHRRERDKWEWAIAKKFGESCRSIGFPSLFVFGFFCLRQKRELDTWEWAIATKFAGSCRNIGFAPLFKIWLFLSAPKKRMWQKGNEPLRAN